VIEKKQNFEIIFFNDLVSAPHNFMDKINNLVFNNKFELNSINLNELISNYSGAKDTLGSSKPNKVKEKIKKDLKAVLFELKEYQRAKSLYNKIEN
tara:strand:+ start:522 stop:809 length:288 start_codon:yes stop_codon:yes gene_type:complete